MGLHRQEQAQGDMPDVPTHCEFTASKEGVVMRFITEREATFECGAGEDIYEAVREVHGWFYTGDGKHFEKATIRNLNGVKITFEREGK
jgi:hypothetical protein